MQAIHLYTEGLRREPSNAMVFSNRSAAFLHSSDFRSALSDAEKAIKLQPTWSKVSVVTTVVNCVGVHITTGGMHVHSCYIPARTRYLLK